MTVIVYLILTEDSTSRAHNQIVGELDALGAHVILFMHAEGVPAVTHGEEGMPAHFSVPARAERWHVLYSSTGPCNVHLK